MGDIFNARIAGNVINDDVLGSLEFATSAAGAKLVLVVGHTRCGAVSGACKHVELGHLTGLLAKIRPAVARARVSGNGSAGPGFEDAVAVENVRLSVEQIRKQSTILQTLESQGKILIQGAMYHLDTGRVELLKL
jgi:carbonic anhydrase